MALRLLALARTLVPSTDRAPKLARPMARAILTTSTNRARKSSRWRRRNSQTVRCCGKLPTASMRKAMSSSIFLAILRDENVPVA